MDSSAFIASCLYEGLMYGCGVVVTPFLLWNVSTESGDRLSGGHFLLTLAFLTSAFHLGDLLGKTFAYNFSACFNYYSTFVLEIFCFISLIVFGFSSDITWLFISRSFLGFMTGVLSKISVSKAANFSDYSSYEFAFGFASLLFSVLYWSSLDTSASGDSSSFIQFGEDYPAAIGACVVSIFIVVVYIGAFFYRILARSSSHKAVERESEVHSKSIALGPAHNAGVDRKSIVRGRGSLAGNTSTTAPLNPSSSSSSSSSAEAVSAAIPGGPTLESRLIDAESGGVAATGGHAGDDEMDYGEEEEEEEDEDDDGFDYDDPAFLARYDEIPNRYIRGCNNDMDEARRRWGITMDWRRDYDVEGILDEVQPYFHKIKECYPHFFHNRSKDGHPVYVERVGYIDKKRMADYNISVPALLRHYVFITEYMWKVIEPNEDTGASISIMDVENVGIKDLMGDTLEFLTQSSKVIQGHYVERCHRIFILNTPYFFNLVWKAVQPMVHENTRKKIRILGSSKEELLECIDASQLPPEYGGTGGPLGSSPIEKELSDFVDAIAARKIAKDAARAMARPRPGYQAATETSNNPLLVDRQHGSSATDVGSTTAASELSAEAAQFAATSSSANESNNRDTYVADDNEHTRETEATASTWTSYISEWTNHFFINSQTDSTAFLGEENKYVFDKQLNRWVIHGESRNSLTAPDPSRTSLPANEQARASVAAPSNQRASLQNNQRSSLHNNRRSSVTWMRDSAAASAASAMESQDYGGRPSAVSFSRERNSIALTNAIVKARKNNEVPNISEFRKLCIVLAIFEANLVFILEFISVWLYLPNEDGGYGYSTTSLGAIFSIAAVIAGIFLLYSNHPRHVRYEVKGSYRDSLIDTGGGRGSVVGRRSEGHRKSETGRMSTSSKAKLAARESNKIATSRVSLQALFWLELLIQAIVLIVAIAMLPTYFREVTEWPGPKSVAFHILSIAILSTVIAGHAVVFDCFVAVRRASVVTSRVEMRLNAFVGIVMIIASFAAPLVFYLIRSSHSTWNSSDLGAVVLIVPAAITVLLFLYCYCSPPRYPLFFYV